MTTSESVETTTPRSLEGIRIVDFTWVRAGPIATRWLGTLGAEVIKVEWPLNMDILRSNRFTAAPGMVPGPNTIGQFNDTNANKLGITVNTRTDKGLDLIRRLISTSDVVIENFSSRIMQRWNLGYEQLKELKEDIIYVSMAGFGHTGRDHYYGTMGPAAQALSGLTFQSGLPGEQPAGWGWSYLDDTGGMYGAMTVLTALHHRRNTGKGQHVDLSQMITGITLTGSAFLDKSVNSRTARREGYPPGNRAVWPGTELVSSYRGPTVAPHNSYPTKGGEYNGWAVIVCFSDEEWKSLVDLMGNPEWAQADKYQTIKGRIDSQEEMDAEIAKWTRTMGKYELMEKCQAAGVRAMPVQSSQDRVENDPQIQSRDYFMELEHPLMGVRKFQMPPFRLSKSPGKVYRPSPLIGQHNREVFSGMLGLSHDELAAGYEDGTFWPPTMEKYDYIEEIIKTPLGAPNAEPPKPADPRASGEPEQHGPLHGLRVLELADVKGQWCGKLMADLGADVVKIEPPGGEATRTLGPYYEDLPDRERSLSFWHYNTSKRGVTLSLDTADGRELFKNMAAKADIILETFEPGYMAERGLGYDELSKSNPGLIMCSLTDFGQKGPWVGYKMSDLLHLAAGGQMASCGYDAEDVPNASPMAPDGGNAYHMGGHFAYIGIMAALSLRDVTGEGQYIDSSVHEACCLTTESAVPTYLYTGLVVERHTGRHAAVGPSENIQIQTQDGGYVNTTRSGTNLNPRRLNSLAEWMNEHDMAGDLLDEKFQTQQAIEEGREHITRMIESFFAVLPLDDAWRGGQERDFPWGAIRTMDELMEDPHLEDRGFYVDVKHPELGKSFVYPGGAAIYNGSPWDISRRAPLIGEHNVEILCGELGLSKAELSALAEAGVV